MLPLVVRTTEERACYWDRAPGVAVVAGLWAEAPREALWQAALREVPWERAGSQVAAQARAQE